MIELCLLNNDSIVYNHLFGDPSTGLDENQS
jgi:hypothetical protein